AGFKLERCPSQQSLSIKASMPCKVDTTEQQVAHFIGNPVLIGASKRLFKLLNFLPSLGKYRAHIRPVKARLGGPFLDLLSPDQRRQGSRDIGQKMVVAFAAALSLLDAFPLCHHLVFVGWLSRPAATLKRSVRKHMGVTCQQLAHDAI